MRVTVFRFLRKQSYATELLQGRVRLSTLGECRRYEDAERGDPGEAHQQYSSGAVSGLASNPAVRAVADRMKVGLRPGNGEVTIEDGERSWIIPDAWVICACAALVPSLRPTFGDFVVRIDDAARFAELVTRRLLRASPCVRGPIVYRERRFVGMGNPPGPLGFVKPPAYEHQQEYRFVWTPTDGAAIRPLFVECGSLVDVVSPVDQSDAGF